MARLGIGASHQHACCCCTQAMTPTATQSAAAVSHGGRAAVCAASYLSMVLRHLSMVWHETSRHGTSCRSRVTVHPPLHHAVHSHSASQSQGAPRAPAAQRSPPHRHNARCVARNLGALGDTAHGLT
eukprot:358308-Chlamydomonas_euryale.AAC.7